MDENEEPVGENETKTAASEIDPFREVRELLERGDVTGAQGRLDRFEERSAEWHYLQAVIYRKRNWLTESRKSLETAIELDPENENYQTALKELNAMAESVDPGKKSKKKKRRLGSGWFERNGGVDGCCDACCEGCSAGCGAGC